ncbi:hypothetical protein SAMN05421788_106117 [Filimonas lacunae]|uniref:Uncharacterized protein n=1 Tax=Filimonas lacunae TaxID=477680 RepID=A0A173MF38_9BACT|nr:hypothetical protein [Filimonas lacunae]BAV06048.1 hypothetical protein FLA_2063 [Filimonas lacunae]SIT24391.1 hypothetical protein SAMN05421788_106117 [Filimonas lacunae]
MLLISSNDVLEAEIAKVPGKPAVLEVLWDGDSEGWFLYATLYSLQRKFFRNKMLIHRLGVIRFNGDHSQFNGTTPDWPEAAYAVILGRQMAEKYDLTFYFPSEKEPEDNCPGWMQRHKGVSCADCNKLILPVVAPDLPRNICYNCYLKKEYRNKR